MLANDSGRVTGKPEATVVNRRLHSLTRDRIADRESMSVMAMPRQLPHRFRRADHPGRRLLGELERTAGEAGVVVLRLETNRALSEVIALYKRSGYVEVKAFNAEPYAHHWFEKTLRKKTQTGRVQ
jgi:hypothetical protein